MFEGVEATPPQLPAGVCVPAAGKVAPQRRISCQALDGRGQCHRFRRCQDPVLPHRIDDARGFNGDDVAFCRALTKEAKVTAIPVTAFYASDDPPLHYARFAFCKGEAVIDEALARLRAWVAGRGRQLTAAAG